MLLGSISIAEVDNLFADNASSETIQTSLKMLYSLYDLVLKQSGREKLTNFGQSTYMVNNYFALRQTQKQAEEINLLRNQLKLQGTFENLDQFMVC